ncbi:hypothetical protein GCM10011339_20090 [Echinicola rosea]|uniref:Acyltransferase n=2 Tax=Echinicola rosea TaxID=1807691 RepID=A0ABQ1V0M0_9BACT|nr:hypothetical protein GCM10011339_20090 [Echinicola rosea]
MINHQKGIRIDYNVRMMFPNNIVCGKNCIFGKGVRIYSEFSDSLLKIGDGVSINENCLIDFSGNVDIGDKTVVSRNAVIYSHSHGINPYNKPVKKELYIGKNVWIGSNALITENVSYIGSGAVVAAGAIVTKNVEEKTIVGGNPARLIKTI